MSQALTANLLWRGLLSQQGHRSHQNPAPAQALHRVTDFFRHAPALMGLPWPTGGYLLHRGPPRTAGALSVSPWSVPQTAGESLLRRLEDLFPSFLTDPGVCRVSFR